MLTDIRMPPDRTDDGLRAALRIRAAAPGTAVVVLSQHVQRQYAVELLGDRPAGVGYLLKQRIADVAGFCRDLRRVADGGVALDPEVVAAMIARRDDAVERLCARRREVLALIAEGRSNAAHRPPPAGSPRRPSSRTPPASTTPSASPTTSTTTAASSPSSAT